MYVFMMVHTRGSNVGRKLLTVGSKNKNYAPEILALLQAVAEAKQVAIMHCPGHLQLGSSVA